MLRVIFFDETSTSMTLTPLRARAPRGERVPRGRWTAITFVAALTVNGLGPGLQFVGALDRSTFETFLTHVLVPALRPGDRVVRDDPSVH